MENITMQTLGANKIMLYSVFGNQENFFVDKDVDLQNTLFNTSCGYIDIKRNVFFGHNVMVLTGSHDISLFGKERMNSWQKYKENNIIINEGVWISSGSIILGPCTIGKNSVVGAGSIVLPGQYPENSLIVGNPAKVKKSLIV